MTTSVYFLNNMTTIKYFFINNMTTRDLWTL